MYEYARYQTGDTAVPLSLLPLKLLYAATLAEHGCVQEALQYCHVLQRAMRLDREKPPPCLAVCAAQLVDLRDQLQQHAAAHNIKVR